MESNGRISIISSNGSSSSSDLFQQDFSGKELLLLLRLQSDPELFESWKANVISGDSDEYYSLSEVPATLWFMAVTLDRKKDRLLDFIQEQIRVSLLASSKPFFTDSLLARYLNSHMFTELHLDSIFKYGDDNTLPLEMIFSMSSKMRRGKFIPLADDEPTCHNQCLKIFKCPSVRRLSLKYNYLDRIPADIGRMSNLEYLALTSNKLQNKSLPYTLTFCRNLETLLLDNNLLDALPGFLLRMPSLSTVHRHGNHNYFKSTFMWYHTDFNERILRVQGTSDLPTVALTSPYTPRLLQFWAAKAITGSRINFFTSPLVASSLRDYIAEVYGFFNVCGYCNKAVLAHLPGYKVITFKNPYLGNTCVPFQHWACSIDCAMKLEVPAREEQIAAARELDQQYDAYVRECHRQYRATAERSAAGALLCTASRRRHHRYQRAVVAMSLRGSSFDSTTTSVSLSRCDSPPRQHCSSSNNSTTLCFGGCRRSCCIS